MSPEWVSILALVALFVVGTLLPINMGALAFVAAWLVGMLALGQSEDDIIGGMSGDLVLTLVGVTYLFAIAKNNGTVDLIVKAAVRSVGGRVGLIPWVMFAVTGLLTAIGAASPAACAIIGPIALGFAGRYRINPLMMGMFVVHGAQAGGFSPISIYGVITNTVMRQNDLPVSEMAIFLSSLLANFAIAVALFFALGGRALMSRRLDLDEMAEGPAPEPEYPSGGSAVSRHTGPSTPGGAEATDGARGASGPDGGRVLTETREDTGAGQKIAVAQLVTLVAFLVLAVLALAFDRNIGFTAITMAVALAILFPHHQKDAVKQIAWSTVLLVAGVTTYAAVLEAAGTPEYVGNWAAGFSTALVGALILCYTGGVVSAFASSTALLPIIIPLAIPLIATGDLSAIGVVAAIAVASTIVDVSPFSTNGALMVANRPDTIDEEKFYKQVLGYGALVVAVGPLLVWAAIVVPGWV